MYLCSTEYIRTNRVINSHTTHSPGEVVYRYVGYSYMYFQGRAAYIIKRIYLFAAALCCRKFFNVSLAFWISKIRLIGKIKNRGILR